MNVWWALCLHLAAPTTWAGHQVVWGSVQVPLLGERNTRSEAWVLAELQQDGDTLHWVERPCRVDMGSVVGVRTQLPTKSLPKLPPTEVRMQRGAQDAYKGSWKSAWSAADLDGDGKPGVTLNIDVPLCSGDVYVAMESTTWATANRFGDDLLGEMNVHVQQHVLGASNMCLKLGGGDAVQVQRGVFRYTPVAATRCEDVAAWPVAAP